VEKKIQKAKPTKKSANKEVTMISFQELMDQIGVPKKVQAAALKAKVDEEKSSTKKPKPEIINSGIQKATLKGDSNDNVRRAVKGKPKTKVQKGKTKEVGSREKGKVAKKSKAKKGPRNNRGNAEVTQPLSDYFFKQLSAFQATPDFPLSTIDYAYSFMLALRPCKLTIKKIINEDGFNPYDDTKERELCICEILAFDDELKSYELDSIFELNYMTKSKAKAIIFYNVKMIDEYFARVLKREE